MSEAQALHHAREELRQGNKIVARQILTPLLRSNPRNEIGWMLMSIAVNDQRTERACLRMVLRVNPDNEIAQRHLDRFAQAETSPSGRVALQPQPLAASVSPISCLHCGEPAKSLCMLDPAVDSRIRKELCAAWQAYVVGDVTASLAALYRSTKDVCFWGSLFSGVRVAECLRSHNHPMLKRVTPDVRRAFALALAQRWLYSAYSVEDGSGYETTPLRVSAWLTGTAPFAVILGTGYVLDIDPETMGKAVDGDGYWNPTGSMLDTNLPVPYEQHAELWPEMASLPALSLAARIAFIQTMRIVQIRSGLAEYERINPVNHSVLENGLMELAEAGLIDMDLGACDLLTNLTVRDLKRFALDEGVKPSGPKHRLVEELVSQVSPDRIETCIESAGHAGKYVRPLVSNLPSLKKYVWAEIHRLDLYLEWIERVHCLRIPPRRYTEEEKKWKSWSSEFPMMPSWGNSTLEEVAKHYVEDERFHEAIELVRRIWDTKCDEIVRNLADEYAWYAHTSNLTSEAVLAYLSPENLEFFQKACETDGIRPWHVDLYGSVRLCEMGISIREPRLLECPGCGIQFMEWSVHPRRAKRVAYRILFCEDCYCIACAHDALADQEPTSEDGMLERLSDLAEAIERVPTIGFMKEPELANCTEEQQVAIVKALLAMPSRKAYEKQFGSWINALVLAGVLEDGTQRMARGTRCIANDGHECLSLAEKTIDDWLSARKIAHEREPAYPYDFDLNPAGRMRADWEVGTTVIEYAGMMDDPEYAAKMETKRELATKLGISLIVLEPDDVLALDGKLGHLIRF